MAKWVCWCPTVDPWPDVPVLGMVINEIFIGIHRPMMFGYVWILIMDGWLDEWTYLYVFFIISHYFRYTSP